MPEWLIFMRRQYCLPDFVVIRNHDYYASVINYFSAKSLVNCSLHSNLFLIHALFIRLLTGFLFIEIWFIWLYSHPLFKWKNIPHTCYQASAINYCCDATSLDISPFVLLLYKDLFSANGPWQIYNIFSEIYRKSNACRELQTHENEGK